MLVRRTRVLPFALFVIVLLLALGLIWSRTGPVEQDLAAVPDIAPPQVEQTLNEGAAINTSTRERGDFAGTDNGGKPTVDKRSKDSANANSENTGASRPNKDLLDEWRRSPIANSVANSQPAAPPLLKTDSGQMDHFERKRQKRAPGLEFRRLTLRDERGRIPVDGLQKAKRQMERMRASQEARARAAGKDPASVKMAELVPADWSWLGPGNIGGRIRSIIIDPANANNMWVGSVAGGIWRTTNAGTSWQPVNDFMANLAVSTMAISPANPTVMYAGTGEGFGNVDALGGGGVFQSTDSGLTWSLFTGTDPAAAPTAGCDSIGFAPCPATWQYVNRVAVSGDGTVLLAATRSGDNNNDGAIDSSGIQRFAGGTWTTRANTLVPVEDVKFDPTNSNLAVAGGLAQAQFSTDGGVTWTASTFFDTANPAGTTTINPLSASNNGRVELAYAPSNSQIVYAAVNNNHGDLYLSTDGGQNFTRVNTGNSFFNSGGGNQGWYDNVVWVNPQDPTFVIVGGIELWRSTDCGTINPGTGAVQCNFAQMSNSSVANSVHADQHFIVAHPGFNNTTNRTVFFANDGGIYKADNVATASTTCDTSSPPNCTSTGWTELNNNLGITQFYGGAVSTSGMVFGGTQDNGTLGIAPTFNPTAQYNTENWFQIAGSDGGYVAADPTDANFLYGETQNLGVFRSTDGGATNSSINGGITDATCTPPAGGTCNPPTNFIAPLILDPNNPNTLLAGGTSLWRSINAKAATPTWTTIKQPTSAPNPANIRISAITVARGNSNLILVGHNDGQIYRSQDGTNAAPTWNRIDNGTPARFVTRLVIDDKHATPWIYATFGGFSDGNIWRSTDFGATWTDVSGTGASSLPSVPIRGLVVGGANPNMLYAGTEVGVFVSEDAGTSWLLPQQGPANVSVDELFWDRGDLVGVTHGRGMYKTRTPLWVTNQRSGSGGACIAPPAEECGCWGAWSCPCTWAGNRVPNQFDDVVVSCAIGGGGTVRNLQNNARVTGTVTAVQSVYNNGTLDGGVIAGDLLNLGTIANLTSSDVIANQLFNAGQIVVRDVKVQGVNGPGSINPGNGNLVNVGTMQGRDLYIGVPTFRPQPGTISGNGTFSFQSGIIDIGTWAALGSSVSFGFNTLLNSGVFDVGPHTLTLSGSFDSFSDDSRFRGVLGSGLVQFAPTTTDGRARLIAQKQFLPSVRILAGEINTSVSGSLLNVPAALGPVTVDNGAIMSSDSTIKFGGDVLLNGSLAIASSCPTCPVDIDFNGDNFTNNGSVGACRFFRFNSSGSTARSQRIIGTGTWSPVNVQIGGNAPVTTSLSLANNVIFSSSQVQIFPGSTLDLSTPDGSIRTFALNTPATVFNFGSITGNPGRLMLQPATGFTTLNWGPAATLDANLHIGFGEVRMSTVSSDIPLGRDLRVEDGATFSLSGPGISVAGNVLNNGTINTIAGPAISFNFTGSSFTNNGTVTGSNLFAQFVSMTANPISQVLTGSGSWSSTQLFIANTSTVNLENFFTFTGSTFFLNGRVNTGAFDLSVPCNVSWLGTGDVFGNVRRSIVDTCTGPIAFGNPFTTIQFTGGTIPAEVTVGVTPSAPAGFPNSILRSYDINALGGGPWTANLRLRYLDSELNGNNESTLSMFRHDGTAWNSLGVTSRNTTDNWVEFAGVTQFSPWTLSSFAAPSPTPTPTVTPTPTPTVTPTPTPTPPPPNQAPIAQADTYSTNEDTQLVVNAPGVLTNDSDSDGPNPITAILAAGPSAAQGTLSLSPSGSFTFTPAADFNGSASFTYLASDGAASSAPATVTVTVNAVNDAPVALDDNGGTTPKNTPLNLNASTLTANDTDVEGGALTVTGVSNPVNGTVSLENGVITFTPSVDYTGPASFEYTVSDGTLTDTGLVSITVTLVNSPPNATDDVAQVAEDSTGNTFSVLSNDTDPDGNSLTISAATDPPHGTVVNNGTTVTYTPDPNFNGSDSFTYTVNDGNGSTDTATVNVTVTPVNDAPAAVDDDGGTTPEDTQLVISAASLLANDTDVDGDALSVTAVGGSVGGSAVLNAGQITFTPALNFNGAASFTYTAADGNGGTDTATVNLTVTAVNDPPNAVDDSATVNEDTANNTIAVLSNDTDLEGSALVVTGVTQPGNGSVSFTAGSVSYTPSSNYFGPDSFTYTISDGNGGTDTASVNVTVIDVPEPPPLPASQITSGSTSCSQFAAGTAATVATAQFTVQARKGTINGITPSSIIYWLRVTAAEGANQFDINQVITTGNFSALWGLAKGSSVFNASCGGRFRPTFTQTSAGAGMSSVAVNWTAPSAGTYFIMLKLAAPSVRNVPVPSPPTVRYEFSAVNVPDSTSGLDLVNQAGLIAELYPFATNEQQMLFSLFGRVEHSWLERTINVAERFRWPIDSSP